MRYPTEPVFLKQGDALALSKRVNLDYEPVRPVVHRLDEGAAIRDLQRFPNKLSKAGGDRELHDMREVHPDIKEVDTSESRSNAQIKKGLDRITEARCRECITKILEDKRHTGEVLLLVGHGASTLSRNTALCRACRAWR
jgi:hypothetical protein